ncbi:MAG: type II secretion system F family protein [Pseudomonadota bacterium]
MTIIIGLGIFISVVLLIEGLYYTFQVVRKPGTKKVRSRLRTLSSGGYGTEAIDIIRTRELSKLPWLNQILLRIPRMHKIDLMLEQGNVLYPVGFLIGLTLLMTFAGFIGGLFITTNFIFSIIVAALLGAVPYFYIRIKKRKRMRKFQEQLPDALDLMARSLRAGHSFSSGLKMVSDEFDDPIGTEFEKVVDEVNYGVGVPDAMKNLSSRVDCDDIRYFVISVIIQRETGGNLSEILENIAHIIRERFKFEGKVRVLASEGKFSALILIALPFVIAFAVFIFNQEYLKPLTSDPAGRMMILVAIIMMVVGIFIIKNIIKIKV